jgi:hypothetical protein
LSREARRAARVSIAAALSSGLAAARSLDAIVTNHLPKDDVTRTVWHGERRVGILKRAEAVPPQAATIPPKSPTTSKVA